MSPIQGVAAAPGIAIGPLYHFHRKSVEVSRAVAADPAQELVCLDAALAEADAQLGSVIQKAQADCGAEQAAIFEAQAMMLQDPELQKALRQAIEVDHLNAGAAVQDSTEHYAQLLESMDNEYFKARAADVRDVAQRLLGILAGVVGSSDNRPLVCPSVIAAEDLTPSDTILFDKSMVLGFCTAAGGVTSHTAILARSLGLPAVVGCGLALLDVPVGATIVIDGGKGEVTVNPSQEALAQFRDQQSVEAQLHAGALLECHKPAVTRDGKRVEVVANIGRLSGAEDALANGAEGVGLLRTEFLYLETDTLPSEQEQLEAYRAIFSRFGSQPVVLRTLDIGGDKECAYLDLPKEMNPFLGVRGLRLCLATPALFKSQLRAVLQAAVGGCLKLMFPMVAVADEVRQARQMVAECLAELEAEGLPHVQDFEIGIMVEVPSAAVMADHLAKVVDFFSIGTNDLTQYTLAVDRTNASLSYLTSAFSPAVLRLIDMVIRAAHKEGKWVGLCGELAGEPLALPVLLGLELDEFSMNPPAIPLAKQILRSLSAAESKEVARQALEMPDAQAVKDLVLRLCPQVAARN